MTVDAQIYAKKQQIKLINTIMGSLCSIELTKGGRSYLNKLKERIDGELETLTQLEKIKINGTVSPILNSPAHPSESANMA